ncbi:hypothetical protein [Rivularia sp. UHCC 0363]|uniref:hypothetical protein n=1 Tax=Rivularia sp. UHCC 0363 TaxID=3110244 RepID=UPI002B21C565|nr:hypothetical protein [Rivularia sp. UHCC 0363]MEA5596528.1 hypothetical protein [Rivularia sp. UHCC 0363]
MNLFNKSSNKSFHFKWRSHPTIGLDISFGAIKSCTALGGAVALIKDEQLAHKMELIEQKYPQKSEFWYLKRVFKFYWLKLLSLPSCYYQILNLMRLLNLDIESTIKKATLGFPTGDLLAKIRYRTPQHLVWFLNYRLSHCDDFAERIQRGKSFLQMLPNNLTIPGNKAEYNSFWVMPIFINSPDTMAAILRIEGFDSARGNRSLFAIDAKPNTPNHLLPIQSQYSMAHILCLPFSPLLTPQELEYLAQLVTVNIDCELDQTENIVIQNN